MASRTGVIGWAAGVLSAVLGALAFGAVLCLWFPAVLTTPALRDVYPMDLVRATIKWALGVAFALGVLSVLLSARWPAAYGIHGNPVPEGYWAQLALPFRRSSAAG